MESGRPKGDPQDARAEVLVRQPLAQYLRECGYQVVEAASPAEVRLLLDEGQQPIDLIFADIGGTVDAGGFALVGWIRQAHPNVSIILAGSIDQATRKAGDLCTDGPDITKPYEHRLILDRIRRSLATRDRKA